MLSLFLTFSVSDLLRYEFTELGFFWPASSGFLLPSPIGSRTVLFSEIRLAGLRWGRGMLNAATALPVSLHGFFSHPIGRKGGRKDSDWLESSR